MSALDDAINSGAPTYLPPELRAFWTGLVVNSNENFVDHGIGDLSEQLGQTFTVEHSLDDGLPDPVTFTSQNNASGAMTAELVGKPGQIATTMGLRTPMVFSGAGTDLFLENIPSDWEWGDRILIFVSVPAGGTMSFTPDYPEDPQSIIRVSDTILSEPTLEVAAGMYNEAAAQVRIEFSGFTNYVVIATAIWARDVFGNPVPTRVADAQSVIQTGTSTTLTTPNVILNRRGYILSAFTQRDAAVGWTAQGGDTEIGEDTSFTNTMVAVSPLSDPGVYTRTGTLAGAFSKGVGVAIAIEIVDRVDMDAMRYFSPFNSDSPVAELDRDTASVFLSFPILTVDGPVSTDLFAGQMADIQLKGRRAELQAVSETRLKLARTVTPPVIRGPLSGANASWLYTWLMAQGGQFVGPAPDVLTRFWASGYGSLKGGLDGQNSYYIGFIYDQFGFRGKTPTPVIGPDGNRLAIYAETTNERQLRMEYNIRPSLVVPYHTEEQYEVHDFVCDMLSYQNNMGSIEFYIRGDAVVTSSTNYVSSLTDLFRYDLNWKRNSDAYVYGQVRVGIRASDRALYVDMGDSGGVGLVRLTTSLTLPQDDDWHFVAFSWSYFTGEARAKVDGSNYSYAGAGFTTTDTNLPGRDSEYDNGLNTLTNQILAHVPHCDIIIRCGPPAHLSPFSIDNPNPFSFNATGRPLNIKMEAVTAVPEEAWDAIAGVARSGLASIRTNEEDAMEFLTLGYFGEAAQMTPTEIVDTQLNASELDVKRDPSKTRNVVTVQFNETRVDDKFSPVMESTTSIEIPRGTSFVTLALDIPAAEIHGAHPAHMASVWRLTNLTGAEVTAGTKPAGVHFMTVNSVADGTGTYFTNTQVRATIQYADSHTVTIKFENFTTGPKFLTNNGDSVPFISIKGYAIRSAPGYVTARDTASVLRRRERSLDVEVPWLQVRAEAQQYASLLVAMLCRPRTEVSLTVMGDPRRKPGQLVTIADSQGTGAAGTWRILSVEHNRNDAQFTQDITIVQVLPPGLWDGPDGWDNSVWGE
ncbi:MAG: hypothetical protein ABW022_22040 [Actinoplanes sp.]